MASTPDPHRNRSSTLIRVLSIRLLLLLIPIKATTADILLLSISYCHCTIISGVRIIITTAAAAAATTTTTTPPPSAPAAAASIISIIHMLFTIAEL